MGICGEDNETLDLLKRFGEAFTAHSNTQVSKNNKNKINQIEMNRRKKWMNFNFFMIII